MKTTKELSDMCSELQFKEDMRAICPLTDEGLLDMIKVLVLQRMEHCSYYLEQHLMFGDAVRTNGDLVVAWGAGHFSFPVYQELEDFLNEPSIYAFKHNALIAQQVAKQLAYNGLKDYTQAYLFNLAMEITLTCGYVSY